MMVQNKQVTELEHMERARNAYTVRNLTSREGSKRGREGDGDVERKDAAREEEWKCLCGMKMDGCTLMIICHQCVGCPLSHVAHSM
ncbi:hypothetical protein EON65_53875 [archaeon]|nr:MAG: hypothetical protein EON65_53875 [archaeon]